MRSTLIISAVVYMGLIRTASAQKPPHGLRVPPGFEVTEFAGSSLANDIYTLTVDPKGRIVVAGRGYIRILVDDDGDGKADRAIEFADNPKDGAMGLYWEGNSLYVTGDGGLRRFRVKDDKPDGPSELIRAMKTGGEHAAHALHRGPDGWLYVLCGNNTGIDKSYATLATSPIKDPVAGCVLRFPPEFPHNPLAPRPAKEPGVKGKDSEIVAQGFRNPYGMDYNLDGELFTFDSDNERCVSLPWYEPTRFYHVIPGGHYGWLSPQRAQFWRMPPYFVDVVAPVCTLGRGSPTGVACYRHTQFPVEYRGGYFLCDWTFGKIHFVKPRWQGSSYDGKPQVFLESVGDNGFAPTGLVVHPKTGDLYVSIGGRGTRGAVYRIRYPKGFTKDARPLYASSRAAEWDPKKAKAWLQLAKHSSPVHHLRALQIMQRFQKDLAPERVMTLVFLNLHDPDRYIRQAVARLVEGMSKEHVLLMSNKLKSSDARLSLALGLYRTQPDLAVVELALADWKGEKETLEGYRVRARLLQLLLGDICGNGDKGTIGEGYTPRREIPVNFRFLGDWAMQHGTSANAEFRRESSRTLALVGEGDAKIFAHILAAWAKCLNDPVEDVHYLAVLSRLSGTWPAGLTKKIADTFVSLDKRISDRKLQRDTHWPLRMAELYAALAKKDPALHTALIQDVDFGQPGHVLFTRAPGFDRKAAAAIFLKKAEADAHYAWTPGVVDLLGELPDKEISATLRRLWGTAGVDAAILPILARNPLPEVRGKFVHGLNSPDLATVRQCLDALEKLPAVKDKNRDAETLALIRALGQVPDKQQPLRDLIAKRLTAITGQKNFAADKQAWTTWFSKTNPELAAKLTNPDGVDVAAWANRLAKIDWTKGEAERGRAVFVKASCATCHSGNQALGPDLAGVTGRFSREDLFTAILQPSRDVPARYQTTHVEAKDGKLYQGIVIYDAVDSLILQTGATTTVRLLGEQIAGRRPSPLSLMPAGLLDRLQDEEIVDLYAYLKSLGKKI